MSESLRDISTIIEDVSYIPIETHSDGLFNSERVTKLMIADEKILILERVGTGALLMFDMNGRFERRIGERGQGPGEYTMIMAFTADDNYLYILDAPRKSVLIYDYSGNYIRELNTRKHPYDIAVLDNGDFLLAYSSHIQPKRMESAYRIEILDKDMNLKKELFPHERNRFRNRHGLLLRTFRGQNYIPELHPGHRSRVRCRQWQLQFYRIRFQQ